MVEYGPMTESVVRAVGRKVARVRFAKLESLYVLMAERDTPRVMPGDPNLGASVVAPPPTATEKEDLGSMQRLRSALYSDKAR
jgi:hypothetical protein